MVLHYSKALCVCSITFCPKWAPGTEVINYWFCRQGVYYLSLAAAGLLVFILALAVIRLIAFCIVWGLTFGRHHLWLLPNLTEDVGFFASFWPLYKVSILNTTPIIHTPFPPIIHNRVKLVMRNRILVIKSLPLFKKMMQFLCTDLVFPNYFVSPPAHSDLIARWWNFLPIFQFLPEKVVHCMS